MPEDAPLETILTLSEALNSLKNYNSSLQLLEVATQLYPSEPAPLRLKAETLNFAGRYDDSLAIYDQFIAADPQDSDAVLGKARVYNYSNRLPEAETTYRQVLAAQPDNYQVAGELADVLGRRGNYPDAFSFTPSRFRAARPIWPRASNWRACNATPGATPTPKRL